MYDRGLALVVAEQIDGALDRIRSRTAHLKSVDELTATPEGQERLDGLCMLFLAIGEALKNLDKITGGSLLSRHPEVDWKGAMGFRDILAHAYFDVDAEQVFWICTNQVVPLSTAVKQMVQELR